jgi:hypothetical protein
VYTDVSEKTWEMSWSWCPWANRVVVQESSERKEIILWKAIK